MHAVYQVSIQEGHFSLLELPSAVQQAVRFEGQWYRSHFVEFVRRLAAGVAVYEWMCHLGKTRCFELRSMGARTNLTVRNRSYVLTGLQASLASVARTVVARFEV